MPCFLRLIVPLQDDYGDRILPLVYYACLLSSRLNIFISDCRLVPLLVLCLTDYLISESYTVTEDYQTLDLLLIIKVKVAVP